MEAIEGCGFMVCALDARAWALARACRPVINPTELAAILDIGEHAALLAFVHGGVPVYQRPMRDSGLARLRTRIHESLSLAPDVADYLLDSVARTDPKTGPMPDDGAARQTAALIDEHIDALATEVRTALEYATRRYPATLGPMSVVGPGAAFARLGERLSSALGLLARAVTPADLVKCSRPLAESCRDAAMTAALGLAQWGRAAA
jgi:Tfp pilus assembly PilM family ATPase